MKEKAQKANKGKRTALIVVFSLLALILVLLIAVVIWGKSLLGRINRLDGSVPTLSAEEIESIRNETDPLDPDFTGPTLDAEDVTMPTGPADSVEDGENIINVLLVGQDRREGQSRQRSDAMILCTINKSEKTLTMTSFLRDLWVRIPGYYDERLNVPYAIGGFPLLNETLEYQFGISADHNIEVDFSGFQDVIDIIGGVSISLTSREAKHLNGQNSAWNLHQGINRLNGRQALAYARIRALDNDFGRTNRQRTVLNAIVEGMRSLSVSELYKLVKSILPLITTDMSDADILGYVVELAPILPKLKVVSQRIPMDGAYSFASIDRKSVIFLSPENLEKNKQLVQLTLGE